MGNPIITGLCKEIIFSDFFKNHAKSLRNYLLYKFGNEEYAEDITQETFIKLWQNCVDVPTPRKFEITENIQILYRWIVKLGNGKYKVDVPGSHSERLSIV